jgi:hypothetical protein
VREQETLGFQNADRLADRIAGHPELGGEPLLREPVAGLVQPVDDAPAQLVGDLVAQRTVAVADRP